MKVVIIIVVLLLILGISLGTFFMLKQTPEQSQEAVDSLAKAEASSTSAPPAPILTAFGASAGASPCSSYQDSDVNLSDACIKDIWFNVAKCPNNSPDTVPYYIQNKGTMTKLQITNDAKAWASMTDDVHRKACYGDDKTKWPASYIRYLRSNRNYLHY